MPINVVVAHVRLLVVRHAAVLRPQRFYFLIAVGQCACI